MFLSLMLIPAEKILNRYLQLDPETNPRLTALNGKVIAIELQNFGCEIFWIIQQNHIRLTTTHEGLIDVTLRGAPLDFLRLKTQESSSAALFASNITVLGDIDVARHFKALFANLDIDWEEQLSKATGDVVAHQTANMVRGICQWAKQSTAILGKDLTEYTQEEARWLPPRAELQDFFADIDTLRNDIERLELRLARLQKNTLIKKAT